MRIALTVTAYLAIGCALASLEARHLTRKEMYGEAPVLGLFVVFWPVVGTVVLLGMVAFGIGALVRRWLS